MRRTFGQLQQDLANNPILFSNELPPRHLEAGQYLRMMVDAEYYDEFLTEFPVRFPDLVGKGFGYHCIAFCRLYQGDKVKARDAVVTAIQVRSESNDPCVWVSHQVYGRILDMLWNDYQGALAEFEKSLVLRPGEPLTVISMLCAASKNKDVRTCTKIIEELDRLTPPWSQNEWIVDRLRNDVELVYVRSLQIWVERIESRFYRNVEGVWR